MLIKAVLTEEGLSKLHEFLSSDKNIILASNRCDAKTIRLEVPVKDSYTQIMIEGESVRPVRLQSAEAFKVNNATFRYCVALEVGQILSDALNGDRLYLGGDFFEELFLVLNEGAVWK